MCNLGEPFKADAASILDVSSTLEVTIESYRIMTFDSNDNLKDYK